jgi:predicted O-methyltransferase YrrM
LKQRLKVAADVAAVMFGWVFAPALRFLGRRRLSLARFQRFSDRAGFQIRSTHYYEPTYAAPDLPADTTGERPLPGLDLNGAGQLALLRELRWADELAGLPMQPQPGRFGYLNNMYGVGDAELYYSLIRLRRPRRIIEIGSGHSTLVALEALAANRRDDPAYRCDFACIEPFEAPWLETTGVRVVRERVEHVDLAFFDELRAGDILFIDSSHVIRPYGDVLRELQQIVPRLAPGVLVHVHDVFTPRDYPEKWLREHRRLWNEQYLLESFLTYNSRFEVVCAANWLKHNHFDALARACPMLGRRPHAEPGAFWFAAK